MTTTKTRPSMNFRVLLLQPLDDYIPAFHLYIFSYYLYLSIFLLYLKNPNTSRDTKIMTTTTTYTSTSNNCFQNFQVLVNKFPVSTFFFLNFLFYLFLSFVSSSLSLSFLEIFGEGSSPNLYQIQILLANLFIFSSSSNSPFFSLFFYLFLFIFPQKHRHNFFLRFLV